MKIEELLNNVLHKIYGKEVRQSFVDAIRQCYKDATGHPESVAAIIKENDELSKKITTEISDRKSEIDIERKRINNIVTGTASTIKFLTVKSPRIGTNNTSENVSYTFSSINNDELKAIKDKKPIIVETNMIMVTGGEQSPYKVPSTYMNNSTNDDFIVTIYPDNEKIITAGQLGFYCTMTVAYEETIIDTSTAEVKDIRIGIDGTVYDNAGEAVRQQIGSLKEDLVSVTIEEKSNNLLRSELNFTKGKYLSIRRGEYVENENYMTSDFVKVKECSSYVLSSFKNGAFEAELKCIFIFYDSGKNFMGGADTNKFTTQEGCRYIRFCPPISKADADIKLMLEEATEASKNYVDFYRNVYLNRNMLEKTNEITVDANGNGDFIKLQDAINSIKNPSERNKYVIYIREGVYNLAEGIKDGETDKDVVGVTIPNYTTLIGVGDRDKIILTAKFYNKMQYVSTLNFKETGAIENLTVIGENTRYVIHDDDARNASYYKRCVKHCIIKGISTYYSVVYGSGSGDGADWEFQDVTFDGSQSGIGKKPGNTFTVHNLLSSKKNRNIVFRNCRFISEAEGNVKFKTLAYRTATGTDSANNMLTNVEFYGCKFGGKTKGFELVEENPTVYGKGCYYYVTGYGNSGGTFDIITTDDQDYTYRVNLT